MLVVKSTGIVRRVDDLGRIVLPMELRKILDIEPRDSLEIFTENNKIILQKYEPQCIFCGQTEDISLFKMRNVCKKCKQEISENGEIDS